MQGSMMQNKQRAGKALARLRESIHISQAALAERIDVSQPTVAGWELGMHRPRATRWMRMAKALGVKYEVVRDIWT